MAAAGWYAVLPHPVPAQGWQGNSEDRDVAFVEGLYSTGLRIGEWSSILTVELPHAVGEQQ